MLLRPRVPVVLLDESENGVVRPRAPIDNNEFEEGRDGSRPRTARFSVK